MDNFLHLNAFAIYDKKGMLFLTPYFAQTKAQGIRHFNDLCKQTDLPFSNYPEDFDLCFVGHFDTSKGAFVPSESPMVLASADEFSKVA